MEGIKLTDIVNWIVAGELTFSQAVVNYNLSGVEKGALRELLRSVKVERKQQEAPIREALLADMKANPQDYYAERLDMIFQKEGPEEILDESEPDAYRAFMASDAELTFEEVAQALSLPPSVSESVVCSGEFLLPEYYFEEYWGEILPLKQTDVYLLGAAGVGKSSLAASLIRTWVDKFDGEPESDQTDVKQKEYYEAVKSLTGNFHKFPISSDKDMLLYCQLKFHGSRKHITMIDCGPRALVDLANENRNKGRRCIHNLLSNGNDKVIFFLIDYGMVLDDNARTISNLLLSFESALLTLTHDGPGGSTEGCTMSRTCMMGILFTQCDKGGESIVKVKERIDAFVDNYMLNLRNSMSEFFEQYKVNKQNNYSPYILSHSMGKVTIGNTLLYDSSNSTSLARLIFDNCPNRSIFDIFE